MTRSKKKSWKKPELKSLDIAGMQPKPCNPAMPQAFRCLSQGVPQRTVKCSGRKGQVFS